ncbi:hypothetical protein SAMN04490248_1862 [Salinihabitans flavidus]|uniref:Uncharacterized protein n=1 Tax=Salinihabitans flavidus TaxID=569882 RepID=A0A1H8WMN3_9RHOB|nr:hypothetical protein [Salinihabitans flavidus]SEP28895.1 hypothetical protein SAMN04490248_1862 [Salinihabitans flavidus]
MFDPARMARRSFARFGIDAIVDPDGAAVALRMIPFQGDLRGEFGSLAISSPGTLYEVLAEDWPGGGKGTVFIAGGQRRVVQETPVPRDARGLVLVLNSHPEAG